MNHTIAGTLLQLMDRGLPFSTRARGEMKSIYLALCVVTVQAATFASGIGRGQIFDQGFSPVASEIPEPAETAIRVACRSSSLKQLKVAFQIKGDSLVFNPDSGDKNGRTALMDICKFGNSSILHYFLLRVSNPDIYAHDEDGNTALSEALERNSSKLIVALYSLDGKAKNLYPDPRTFETTSPDLPGEILCRACVVGDTNIVRMLYDGYKEYIECVLRLHPCEVAALAGRKEVIKLLMDTDTELDLDMQVLNSEWRLIDLAHLCGHGEIVQYLMDNNIERCPDATGLLRSKSQLLLVTACKLGIPETIKKLINDCSATLDHLGWMNLVNISCRNDQEEILNFLINSCGDAFDHWSPEICHPILVAVEMGLIGCGELLAESHVWCRIKEEIRKAAIHTANRSDNFQGTRYLLTAEYGKDVMKTINGAVDGSCEAHSKDCLDYLFNASSGTHKDDLLLKSSVLLEIIRTNSAHSLRLFLSSGLAYDVSENYCYSAIRLSIDSRSDECFGILIENGVGNRLDANAKDALLYASVLSKSLWGLQRLFKHGFGDQSQDFLKSTCLSIAKKKQWTDISYCLTSHWGNEW